MKRIERKIVILTALLALPIITEASSLQELEQQCNDAREQLIAPLRQEAINQCIADRESGARDRRSSADARQHCERFYANFGAAGTTQSGSFRQRMFHNIAECQPFYEAESAARRR